MLLEIEQISRSIRSNATYSAKRKLTKNDLKIFTFN